MSSFDELAYLELNPDVEAAIVRGEVPSAYEHWRRHGKAEGRRTTPPPDPPGSPPEWSEAGYLAANPDVAVAVRAGAFKSGYDHWRQCGAWEDRPNRCATLPPHHARSEDAHSSPAGINVFGHLSAATGLGSAARGYLEVLRSCTGELGVIDIPAWGKNRLPLEQLEPESSRAINFIHQNPAMIPFLLRRYRRSFFGERYNIGFWVWELQAGYAEWEWASRLFDEIWTPSRFAANAFANIAAVPIHVVPHVVDGLPPDAVVTRADLGLPARAFTFVYVFDIASSWERKNPLALVRAFRNAFGDRDDVRLLLKYQGQEAKPQAASLLASVIEGRRNIRAMPGTLPEAELYSLFQLADCFVSPHRSEGFGLNIATAMYYGKPVIATGYSGNLDFTTPDNSYLIDYRLISLPADEGVYRKGYAWAEPSIDHLSALLRAVASDPEGAKRRGQAGKATIQTMCSAGSVRQAAMKRLHAIPAAQPSQWLRD